VNRVACQRLWQLQLQPIATTIASCKHPVWGVTKPPATSYVFVLERCHASTHHIPASYFYVSLIYGEYRYLANVHFCDILHTFIPHFTLHSAEKIRVEFSANYPFTTFRVLQNTPSHYLKLICWCTYTLSSKNVTTLSRYNSDIHESVLIIFGTDVTEKASCDHKVLYFSTSPN